MFSIWFCKAPTPVEGRCPDFLEFLHRQHYHLEFSKELIHCAYFGLLFIEGAGKAWYAYTAVPLLLLTVLAILSMKGN